MRNLNASNVLYRWVVLGTHATGVLRRLLTPLAFLPIHAVSAPVMLIIPDRWSEASVPRPKGLPRWARPTLQDEPAQVFVLREGLEPLADEGLVDDDVLCRSGPRRRS